jgi:hypothetical protein
MLFAFPILFGLTREQEIVSVQLFDRFVEHSNFALTSIHIWLGHPKIQVYRAQVRVVAELSGFRYLLYHWFFTTMAATIFFIFLCQFFLILVTCIQLKYFFLEDRNVKTHFLAFGGEESIVKSLSSDLHKKRGKAEAEDGSLKSDFDFTYEKDGMCTGPRNIDKVFRLRSTECGPMTDTRRSKNRAFDAARQGIRENVLGEVDNKITSLMQDRSTKSLRARQHVKRATNDTQCCNKRQVSDSILQVDTENCASENGDDGNLSSSSEDFLVKSS